MKGSVLLGRGFTCSLPPATTSWLLPPLLLPVANWSTFAPTLKVSTNNELARRKPQWIDFNAGVLLDDVTMDKLLQQFTLYVIDVASGRSRTTAELHGNAEFAIFKTGVTL